MGLHLRFTEKETASVSKAHAYLQHQLFPKCVPLNTDLMKQKKVFLGLNKFGKPCLLPKGVTMHSKAPGRKPYSWKDHTNFVNPECPMHTSLLTPGPQPMTTWQPELGKVWPYFTSLLLTDEILLRNEPESSASAAQGKASSRLMTSSISQLCAENHGVGPMAQSGYVTWRAQQSGDCTSHKAVRLAQPVADLAGEELNFKTALCYISETQNREAGLLKPWNSKNLHMTSSFK